MNRLFVYGIFLDEYQREQYGMSNPQYATVKGYATVGIGITGGTIVEAIPVDDKFCLTGLVVDVAEQYSVDTYFGTAHVNDGWARLDRLEAGYQRIKVVTTDGEEVWMYAG